VISNRLALPGKEIWSFRFREKHRPCFAPLIELGMVLVEMHSESGQLD
jgi:hypothetical protein